jgi:hypothetical protein
MSANDIQVGGKHYQAPIQHWDWVLANDLDYFQGQITKYVARWKKKGGMADLLKAKHFLEKYIEVNQPKPKLAPHHAIAADASKPWPKRKLCTCFLPDHAHPCDLHGIDAGGEPGPGYVDQDRDASPKFDPGKGIPAESDPPISHGKPT